jgi:L-ascorbate metabolism protein UlaG (beta-lactamase superfamily)
MNGPRTLLLPRRNEDPNFANGSVFFVGTATVLIRFAGFTILTDPNFLHQGDHVHLGYGLISRRRTNPAVEIEDLPPLDFIVLSHMHGDHFDRVAERKLNKATPIVSTRHAVAYLKRKGFTATCALRTWETLSITKGEARLHLTAMPGTHAPGPLAAALPPVMGSMMEFGTADETRLRLYISGDTLVHEQLKEIPERYPEIDLALLHLGGTKILGVVMVTMDAKQGVEAIRIVEPRTAIPIHYNDYTVFKSPLEDFKRAVADAGLEDRVRYLSHGDTYEFEVRGAR